jgi:dipeptidyl aminopeptidase/acylaminoacyl peptidase
MSYGGGTLAFDATRGLYPPEVFARTAAGEIVQLTDHNQVWKQIKLPRAEVKSIKTKSGADYEGLLIYPENYKPGVPHPMVTFVHGGPADRFTHYADSRGWATQLAAAGFVVFCPNQRGSTVATFQSMMSIKRDWGGQDLQDILAGVEQLVAAKIADKEKLAIVGWSYGGYMVQMAVGKTNMFKTAVSGAGMGDVALEYMIEDDLGRAMDTTFNGHPLKNPHVYKKISPTTYAKNVKTPILLIQGAADDIDPLAQTQVYYFYLKYYGAPVQLVVYPGEGHRFARDVHITDVFRRMAEWIEAGFSEPKPCESLLNKVISNR